MFFKRFFQKKPVKSNASRQKFTLTNFKFNLYKPKKLYYLPNAVTKKNPSRKAVLRTKSKLFNRYYRPIIIKTSSPALLSFVSNFYWLSFKKKLYNLLVSSYGIIFYTYNTSLTKLLSWWYKNFINETFKITLKQIKQYLFFIKTNTYVCEITLNNSTGTLITTASGSKTKIISHDLAYLITIIKMPSNVKKCVSIFSSAMAGVIEPTFKQNFLINKAGWYKNFGKKSLVRGVAKNPVDHPHGGRTKSIKYPRTPWGRTTKYK